MGNQFLTEFFRIIKFSIIDDGEVCVTITLYERLNKYHGSLARGDKVRHSYQIECYDNKFPFLKNQYVNYKNRKYRT